MSLTIAALALWLFGTVLEEVLDNATVVRLDVAILDWMAARTTPLGLRIFTVITHLGDIPVIPTIAVAGAWVLWRQRHRLVFVCWLSAYFGGVLVAPPLRRSVREEVILATSLVLPASFALLGALVAGTAGFVLAAFTLGIGASVGRLGFDSLLQRDGPDAVRGRALTA